jgi:hypothetical protein
MYGVPGIGFATSITYGVSCMLLLIAGTWLMRTEGAPPGKLVFESRLFDSSQITRNSAEWLNRRRGQ